MLMCVEGVSRACRGRVEGVSRACRGCVDGVLMACRGRIEGVFRACRGRVQGVSRACRGSTSKCLLVGVHIKVNNYITGGTHILRINIPYTWIGPRDYVQSSPVRSGPVRSGPVRSGPVRSGPVRSGPVRSGRQRELPVPSVASSCLLIHNNIGIISLCLLDK